MTYESEPSLPDSVTITTAAAATTATSATPTPSQRLRDIEVTGSSRKAQLRNLDRQKVCATESFTAVSGLRHLDVVPVKCGLLLALGPLTDERGALVVGQSWVRAVRASAAVASATVTEPSMCVGLPYRVHFVGPCASVDADTRTRRPCVSDTQAI